MIVGTKTYVKLWSCRRPLNIEESRQRMRQLPSQQRDSNDDGSSADTYFYPFVSYRETLG